MISIRSINKLSGVVAIAAAFALSAQAQTSLGTLNIGQTTSSPVSVTVPVTTAGTLGAIAVVTGGNPTLDFASAVGGSCTVNQAYTAGSTCTVNVNFSPKFSGTRSGAVVLSNTGGSVIGTEYLQGKGIGAQVAFTSNAQILPVVTDVEGGSYFNGPFMDPNALAVDGNGNIFYANSGFVTSPGTNSLYKLSPTTPGNYIASSIDATLANPLADAVDAAGNVYVTSGGFWAGVSPQVFSYALLPGGTYGPPVPLSVTWADPVNSSPGGIGVDGVGNIYISDTFSSNVYKLTLQSNGSYVQTTIATGISGIWGAAVDGNGNVYVAENSSSQVIKLSPQVGGTYTQTVIASGIGGPNGVQVDGNGNVFLAIYGQPVELMLQSNGTYTPVTLTPAGGLSAYSVAVDSSGNVFVGDGNSGNVYEEPYGSVPSLSFATTAVNSTSSDSPQTITVENIGNTPLVFADIAYPVNFPAAPTTCPIGTPVVVNASCTVGIRFTPEITGTINDTVVLSDNALNGQYTQQNIAVTGIATGLTKEAVLWTGPAQITYGVSLAQILNATATVPGTFTYTTAAGAPISPSTILPVGGYQLAVSFKATASGNILHSGLKLTVVPALLTVTANPVTITYSSLKPTYTYSITGFVNGDTSSVVSGVPTITAGTIRSTSTRGVVLVTSPVGTYAISPTFGSLIAANYTFTFVPSTLTVTAATTPVTIKAKNVTITRGSAIPSPLPYYFTGLLGFDTGATAGSGSVSFTTTATSNSPAGTYPITPATGNNFSAPNYSGVVYAGGTLTIK